LTMGQQAVLIQEEIFKEQGQRAPPRPSPIAVPKSVNPPTNATSAPLRSNYLQIEFFDPNTYSEQTHFAAVKKYFNVVAVWSPAGGAEKVEKVVGRRDAAPAKPGKRSLGVNFPGNNVPPNAVLFIEIEMVDAGGKRVVSPRIQVPAPRRTGALLGDIGYIRERAHRETVHFIAGGIAAAFLISFGLADLSWSGLAVLRSGVLLAAVSFIAAHPLVHWARPDIGNARWNNPGVYKLAALKAGIAAVGWLPGLNLIVYAFFVLAATALLTFYHYQMHDWARAPRREMIMMFNLDTSDPRRQGGSGSLYLNGQPTLFSSPSDDENLVVTINGLSFTLQKEPNDDWVHIYDSRTGDKKASIKVPPPGTYYFFIVNDDAGQLGMFTCFNDSVAFTRLSNRQINYRFHYEPRKDVKSPAAPTPTPARAPSSFEELFATPRLSLKDRIKLHIAEWKNYPKQVALLRAPLQEIDFEVLDNKGQTKDGTVLVSGSGGWNGREVILMDARIDGRLARFIAEAMQKLNPEMTIEQMVRVLFDHLNKHVASATEAQLNAMHNAAPFRVGDVLMIGDLINFGGDDAGLGWGACRHKNFLMQRLIEEAARRYSQTAFNPETFLGSSAQRGPYYSPKLTQAQIDALAARNITVEQFMNGYRQKMGDHLWVEMDIRKRVGTSYQAPARYRLYIDAMWGTIHTLPMDDKHPYEGLTQQFAEGEMTRQLSPKDAAKLHRMFHEFESVMPQPQGEERVAMGRLGRIGRDVELRARKNQDLNPDHLPGPRQFLMKQILAFCFLENENAPAAGFDADYEAQGGARFLTAMRRPQLAVGEQIEIPAPQKGARSVMVGTRQLNVVASNAHLYLQDPRESPRWIYVEAGQETSRLNGYTLRFSRSDQGHLLIENKTPGQTIPLYLIPLADTDILAPEDLPPPPPTAPAADESEMGEFTRLFAKAPGQARMGERPGDEFARLFARPQKKAPAASLNPSDLQNYLTENLPLLIQSYARLLKDQHGDKTLTLNLVIGRESGAIEGIQEVNDHIYLGQRGYTIALLFFQSGRYSAIVNDLNIFATGEFHLKDHLGQLGFVWKLLGIGNARFIGYTEGFLTQSAAKWAVAAFWSLAMPVALSDQILFVVKISAVLAPLLAAVLLIAHLLAGVGTPNGSVVHFSTHGWRPALRAALSATRTASLSLWGVPILSVSLLMPGWLSIVVDAAGFALAMTLHGEKNARIAAGVKTEILPVRLGVDGSAGPVARTLLGGPARPAFGDVDVAVRRFHLQGRGIDSFGALRGVLEKEKSRLENEFGGKDGVTAVDTAAVKVMTQSLAILDGVEANGRPWETPAIHLFLAQSDEAARKIYLDAALLAAAEARIATTKYSWLDAPTQAGLGEHERAALAATLKAFIRFKQNNPGSAQRLDILGDESRPDAQRLAGALARAAGLTATEKQLMTQLIADGTIRVVFPDSDVIAVPALMKTLGLETLPVIFGRAERFDIGGLNILLVPIYTLSQSLMNYFNQKRFIDMMA
jgi:hypothetical protein